MYDAELPVDFTGNYDIEVYRALHLENWKRDVSFMWWRRLIRDPRLVYDAGYRYDAQYKYDEYDSVDPLYNEAMEKRYHPPVRIRIFFQEQGNQADLFKLGIIESRPAICKFSVFALEEAGFSSDAVAPGDLILYEQHEYEISTVIGDVEAQWLSSSIPFILLCKLNVVDRISA